MLKVERVRVGLMVAALACGASATSCSSGGSDSTDGGSGAKDASAPAAAADGGAVTTVALESGYSLSFELPDGWEGFTCEDIIGGEVPDRSADWVCDPDDGGMFFEFAEEGKPLSDQDGEDVNDETCAVGFGYVYPQDGPIDDVESSPGEAFGPDGDMRLWPFDAEGDPCPGGRLDIPTGGSYVRLVVGGPDLTEAGYEAFMDTVRVAPS